MKLQKYLLILPLIFTAFSAFAKSDDYTSTFNFSFKMDRHIERDFMTVSIYSREIVQSVEEAKNTVAKNLNAVLQLAKSYPTISVAKEYPKIELEEKDVIDIAFNPNTFSSLSSNFVNSKTAKKEEKKKVKKWQAQGIVEFESNDLKSMENFLKSLDENVTLNYIHFRVSPEKMARIEDEFATEIVQKLQHKAEVLKKALKAKKYVLENVKFDTTTSLHRSLVSTDPFQKKLKFPIDSGVEDMMTEVSCTVKFK